MEREMPRLLALARLLGRDGQDAHDAVQDAIERAWRERSQLQDIAAAGAWVRRILSRRIIDVARRQGSVAFGAPEEFDHLLPTVEDPASLVAAADDEMALRAALRELSAIDRLAVVLHDGEGWRAVELADLLGISTDAAHKRVQRARVRLIGALATTRSVTRAPSGECRHARTHAHDLLDEATGVPGTFVLNHLERCPRCPAALQAAAGVIGALRVRGDGATATEAMRLRLELLLQEGEEAR